jgi:hypothetical protein
MKTKKDFESLKSNPQSVSQDEVKGIVTEVSKLITLPSDISPILATVNDPAKLKERQPFFKDAEVGDKVLMYTNVNDPAQRKAYLYRPSTKQLLNVAPISIGNTIQPQEDAFSVEIRNGTTTPALEDRMQILLGQVFPKATVATKGNSTKKYDKSVIVKVNASDDLAKKVSQLFNAELVTLPAGEKAPGNVDLMILLGGKAEAAASGSPEASKSAGQ